MVSIGSSTPPLSPPEDEPSSRLLALGAFVVRLERLAAALPRFRVLYQPETTGHHAPTLHRIMIRPRSLQAHVVYCQGRDLGDLWRAVLQDCETQATMAPPGFRPDEITAIRGIG